jgi:hypothetical protein
MAATTYGIAGKSGKLVINGITLKLTKFSLPITVGKAEITNSESPTTTLGANALVSGEYVPTIFDAKLTFEGVYTIIDTPPSTLTGLLTGSGGISPAGGSLPASSNQFGYLVTLSPDRGHAASIITGNVLIENFELTGELKGIVSFKGDGTFTGGLGGSTAQV